MFGKTKIIATVGPATDTEYVLRRLIDSGANIMRLNFSHGSHNDHKRRFSLIRHIEADNDEPVAVIQDLQGSKIRLGILLSEKQMLKPHQKITLFHGQSQNDIEKLPVQYNIFPHVKEGDSILINDGIIQLHVQSPGKDSLTCEVVTGGEVSSNKGLNLPHIRLPNASFTKKDEEDLDFGLQMGVDYVAVSFVQAAEDVEKVKEYIKKAKSGVKVIAKIEQAEAIRNLDEIITVSDGVMIARGDLAIEVGQEEVPILQRRIINLCSEKGVPVIVATQMLESMIHMPTPTRAEVNDIATAVFEQVDAVMLSAETALGEYPIECVGMMKKIIHRVENYQKNIHREHTVYQVSHAVDQTNAIAKATAVLAHQLGAAMIIALTASGVTACRIAMTRLPEPFVAITDNIFVYRQLTLIWGVRPYFIPKITDNALALQQLINRLTKEGKLKKHDRYVAVEGTHPGRAGHTNSIRVGLVE